MIESPRDIILKCLENLNANGRFQHTDLKKCVTTKGVDLNKLNRALKKMRNVDFIHYKPGDRNSSLAGYALSDYEDEMKQYIDKLYGKQLNGGNDNEISLHKSYRIPNKKPITKDDEIWIDNKIRDMKRNQKNVELLILDIADQKERCQKISDWYMHDSIKKWLNEALKDFKSWHNQKDILEMIKMGFRYAHENQDYKQWNNWYNFYIDDLINIFKQKKGNIKNRKYVFNILRQEIIMASDNKMPKEVSDFILWCFEDFSKKQMELFEFHNTVRFIPKKDLVEIKSKIKELVSNIGPGDEKKGVYLKKMLSKDPFLGL